MPGVISVHEWGCVCWGEGSGLCGKDGMKEVRREASVWVIAEHGVGEVWEVVHVK